MPTLPLSSPPSSPSVSPIEPAKGKKLLAQYYEALRNRHYSLRTEQTYIEWIRRFILFHGKRHPKDMGPPEIAAFIAHLAVGRNVAVSSQNPCIEPVEVRPSAPSSMFTALC